MVRNLITYQIPIIADSDACWSECGIGMLHKSKCPKGKKAITPPSEDVNECMEFEEKLGIHLWNRPRTCHKCKLEAAHNRRRYCAPIQDEKQAAKSHAFLDNIWDDNIDQEEEMEIIKNDLRDARQRLQMEMEYRNRKHGDNVHK